MDSSFWLPRSRFESQLVPHSGWSSCKYVKCDRLVKVETFAPNLVSFIHGGVASYRERIVLKHAPSLVKSSLAEGYDCLNKPVALVAIIDKTRVGAASRQWIPRNTEDPIPARKSAKKHGPGYSFENYPSEACKCSVNNKRDSLTTITNLRKN